MRQRRTPVSPSVHGVVSVLSLSLSLSLSLCLSVSLFLTLVFGAAAAPQDSGGNIRERRDDVSVEISFRMSGSAACLEKLE
jgi:hypothetical protein